MAPRARIVVGLDGSEGSFAALATGAREAALRGGVLHVVMTWDYLDQPRFPGKEGFDPHWSQAESQAHLEGLLTSADAVRGVDVEAHAVCDHAASALIDAGEGADLLVVGARGQGGFLGLRLGSVSQRVLTHAPCPVIVVRTPEGDTERDGDDRIVVGIDGSRMSRTALDWSLQEAAWRSTGLVAIHAWTPIRANPGLLESALPSFQDFEGAARSLLDDELHRSRQGGPRVEVESRAVRSGAAAALVEASRHHALVVVGTRGRGGITGRLLGSVSQQVAHHAEAPTAVIPHRPHPA